MLKKSADSGDAEAKKLLAELEGKLLARSNAQADANDSRWTIRLSANGSWSQTQHFIECISASHLGLAWSCCADPILTTRLYCPRKRLRSDWQGMVSLSLVVLNMGPLM
jgi:hypothetical protein